MSWVSPNYAKKASGNGKVPASNIIGVVEASFLVPVYEPLVAEQELLFSLSGDLLTAKAMEVPLINTTT